MRAGLQIPFQKRNKGAAPSRRRAAKAPESPVGRAAILGTELNDPIELMSLGRLLARTTFKDDDADVVPAQLGCQQKAGNAASDDQNVRLCFLVVLRSCQIVEHDSLRLNGSKMAQVIHPGRGYEHDTVRATT